MPSVPQTKLLSSVGDSTEENDKQHENGMQSWVWSQDIV